MVSKESADLKKKTIQVSRNKYYTILGTGVILMTVLYVVTRKYFPEYYAYIGNVISIFTTAFAIKQNNHTNGLKNG
jgi:hypothetical protein